MCSCGGMFLFGWFFFFVSRSHHFPPSPLHYLLFTGLVARLAARSERQHRSVLLFSPRVSSKSWSRWCCVAGSTRIFCFVHLFPDLTAIVQEQCESRGGRPGLSVLTSLLVSVDVKQY